MNRCILRNRSASYLKIQIEFGNLPISGHFPILLPILWVRICPKLFRTLALFKVASDGADYSADGGDYLVKMVKMVKMARELSLKRPLKSKIEWCLSTASFQCFSMARPAASSSGNDLEQEDANWKATKSDD